MRDRHERRPRPDVGFTLIELVVVIALLALVISVLTGAVAVIVRSQSPTESRANEARSLRGLETWLGQDVTGVPPSGFDFAAGTGTGCTGAAAGVNLVRLRWTEVIGGTTTTFFAAYRFQDGAAGTKIITRSICSGTGAGPFANGESVRVSGDLTTTPPTVTPIMSGPATIGVAIQAATISGGQVRATASSQNPANTLPPTTTSTTTTTTTTTTLPPCSVVPTNAPWDTRNESGRGARPLRDDYELRIRASGTCSGPLRLRYDRGDGEGVQTQTFTGTFPNYRLTLAADEDEPWTDGDKTLTVLNGSTPLSPTYTLTVR